MSLNENSAGTESLGEDSYFVGERTQISSRNTTKSVEDSSILPCTHPLTFNESFTTKELSILGKNWRKLPIRGCLALKHKRLDEFVMDDNQIDDIIDNVDMEYVLHNNKGLLSLLHTNAEMITGTNEANGKVIKSNAHHEERINLDYLTKMLMGEIDRNFIVMEMPSGNMVNSGMRDEAQLLLLDKRTGSEKGGGHNPFEPPPTLTHEDGKDVDATPEQDDAKNRLQPITKQIDSWWIQELQNKGWFEQDTSTVDLDQIRVAMTTAKDETRPSMVAQQDAGEDKQ